MECSTVLKNKHKIMNVTQFAVRTMERKQAISTYQKGGLSITIVYVFVCPICVWKQIVDHSCHNAPFWAQLADHHSLLLEDPALFAAF